MATPRDGVAFREHEARRAVLVAMLPAVPTYKEIREQYEQRGFKATSDETIRRDLRAVAEAERERREAEGTADIEEMAHHARVRQGYRAFLKITDPAVQSREGRHWAVYDRRFRGLGEEARTKHPILGELQELLAVQQITRDDLQDVIDADGLPDVLSEDLDEAVNG